ncbi:hypothetical protein J7K50_05350 [bacterium]|nr:hypothetical protein [bacterium]
MMELLATCATFSPGICNVAFQAGQTGAATTFKALIVPTIFIIVLVVALVLVIHYVKETMKRNPVADLDRQFRAEEDTLLALADAKKREREKLAKEAELQETIKREMGELEVDMSEHFDKACPQCLLELGDDTEIVVVVEQNIAIHRACLSDYLALNADVRSKYLYLYPDEKFAIFDEFVKENL